jgi:hypothetical protein
VVLGGDKEYTSVEAMRPHYSRQSRRSHCSRHRGGPTAPTARRSRLSHCSTEAQEDPATTSTSTGVSEQGRSGLRFFLFLKTDFECRLGTAESIFCILRIVSVELTDTKNDFTTDTIKRFCSSASRALVLSALH